jgi:hypothetical protein
MSAAVRVSGKTADEEVIEEIQREADVLPAPELPEERERSFRFPGFSRMRFDWYGDDARVMAELHNVVDRIINEQFHDLLAVRNELYDLVREPEMVQGHPVLDPFGWVVWKRDEDHNYVEDWGKLTRKQQERFLYLINTRMFDWEERADRMWAEAMMSKTQWEEAFSTGWQECDTPKKTEGDRTAAGRLRSQEERYFAIFRTYLSRRAESLAKGMERLGQRIKDVHTA